MFVFGGSVDGLVFREVAPVWVIVAYGYYVVGVVVVIQCDVHGVVGVFLCDDDGVFVGDEFFVVFVWEASVEGVE